MNCAYCGAPVTLEEKYCPHCGRPNVQAEQHSRDMEHYHNEFEKTRRGVYGTLRAYKGITARSIVFVTVLVIAVITCIMMNSVYSIHRSMMVRDSKKNAAEVSARIDDYIEHMDYVSLGKYAEHQCLSNYLLHDHPVLGPYYTIMPIVRSYTNLYDDIMRIYASRDDNRNSYRTSSINDDLGYLYKYLYPDSENSQYDDLMEDGDPRLNERVISDVSQLTDATLITYLGFTEEEAVSLHTMTTAKRGVVIEDKLETLIANRGGDSDE